MPTITFQDKNADSQDAAIDFIRAEDANEIKQSVNDLYDEVGEIDLARVTQAAADAPAAAATAQETAEAAAQGASTAAAAAGGAQDDADAAGTLAGSALSAAQAADTKAQSALDGLTGKANQSTVETLSS